MNSLEEVMCELLREDVNDQGLPPGFRFHPTDEELITYYLASKVFNGGLHGVDFVDVDLNRCEPWELPDVAKLGEKEWYFFSLRDRKYPTGLRTNRATGAGYWKATGKDKEVHRAITGSLVGMKKTLVFYKGRAPRGEKTKWVLHEYRLDGELSCRHTSKEEWVICRIFNKAGGDKKNSYCPHPSYFPATPSYTISSNPSMPPFLDFQTLETQNLHPHPYFHQDLFQPLFPLPLPPSFPPTPTNPIDSFLKPHCPSSQDDSITNWLESYLQSPLVSDMGLGSLGLPPFGGGTINHDMPMMPHIAAPPSGPLDP